MTTFSSTDPTATPDASTSALRQGVAVNLEQNGPSLLGSVSVSTSPAGALRAACSPADDLLSVRDTDRDAHPGPVKNRP